MKLIDCSRSDLMLEWWGAWMLLKSFGSYQICHNVTYRLTVANQIHLSILYHCKEALHDGRSYSSASQPVCRGTQVCRESGRGVPRPNVGNKKFSMRSVDEVFNYCHRKLWFCKFSHGTLLPLHHNIIIIWSLNRSSVIRLYSMLCFGFGCLCMVAVLVRWTVTNFLFFNHGPL